MYYTQRRYDARSDWNDCLDRGIAVNLNAFDHHDAAVAGAEADDGDDRRTLDRLAIALATPASMRRRRRRCPGRCMLALPLIAIGAAALLSAGVRETLLALPVPLLIGLNALRILPGAFILLLASQGKLSGPFPQSAGWGDIVVGVIALPLMVAVARSFAGNPRALLAWNILGTLDLLRRSRSACCRRRDRRSRSLAARSARPRWGAAMVEHSDAAGAVLLVTHGIIFARLAAGERRTDAICCVASGPVNNGNSGDVVAPCLRVSRVSPFNEPILRRWETIAYGSGSSSRLSR